MHILDIFFPINVASWQPPTITMRRHNREKLKRMLLEEFQGKKVVCVEKKKAHSNLIINNALREKLSRDLILEDCIAEVVEHCEKGHKLYEPDSGHFFGHLQIGYTTYWVEYEILEAAIRLINAYSHRIKIETGAI